MRDKNAEYFRPIKKEKEPKESLIKVGSLSDHGKGYGREGFSASFRLYIIYGSVHVLCKTSEMRKRGTRLGDRGEVKLSEYGNTARPRKL